MRPELLQVYDALETPREVRGDVPHLDLPQAHAYLNAVRARTLEVLGTGAGGTVWDMVIQHEHQHNETMLQTLALAEPGVFAPPERRPAPIGTTRTGGMIRIDGGPFVAGAPAGFAYDNERPRHEVDLPAFEIDARPVTNGALRRVRRRRRLRAARALVRPRLGVAPRRRLEPALLAAPTARSGASSASSRDRPGAAGDARLLVRGRRLRALGRQAAPDRARVGEGRRVGTRRRGAASLPVGRRRAHARARQPRPDGLRARARGRARGRRVGVRGARAGRRRLGVDREPSSNGYPGFEAFPYREYSEVFFGSDYRVLRGGSWATRPSVARNTLPQLGPPAAAPDLRRVQVRGVTDLLAEPRIRIDDRLSASVREDIGTEVRDGLTSSPLKELPPKLFYDARGSELFDRITPLPEYYPTRCERAILNRHAPEIVRGLEGRGAGRARVRLGLEDARAAVRDGRRRHAAPLRAC